jgi:8-oxo-dGTP diphosphatase
MNDASIGIVINPDDKEQILWVKRRDLPIWVLPGGGIDSGETPEAAALREVKEESGLEVSIVRKAAQYSPVNRLTAMTHIYICRVEKGTPSVQSESVEVGYFPAASPPYPHFPLHDEWAREALANQGATIFRPLHEFSWRRVGCFFLKHPIILTRYVLLRMMMML